MFQSIDPSGAASCPDETSALGRMLQLWPSAATVLSRARYAEQALAEAVGQGVRQYVILGAGMDTFAFRSFISFRWISRRRNWMIYSNARRMILALLLSLAGWESHIICLAIPSWTH
jgi:hypothetical protein